MRGFFKSIFVLSMTLVVIACSSGGSPNPPDTPQNLVATATELQIDLTWDEETGAETYRLEWHDNGATSSDWSELVTGSATSYSHTGLSNDTTYSYRVIAINDDGESNPSAEASVTTIPATPQSVTAVFADSGITINWDAVTDADAYRVEFHDNGATSYEFAELGTTTEGTDYYHKNVTIDVTYSYRVIAIKGDLESLPSAVASATPRQIPSDLGYVSANINHISEDNNELTLSWPASNNVTAYRVFYDLEDITDASPYKDTVSTSITDPFGMVDGKSYNFMVVPLNHEVAGTASSQITVVTQPKWRFISPGYGMHNRESGRGTAMTYGGGIYLRVGDNGLISRSTNGTDWAVQHSGANAANFNTATWTGQQFVVTGTTTNNEGIVLTSPDGIDWTFTLDMFPKNIMAVASDGENNLMAVGDGKAAYSTDDGVTWTAITTVSTGGGSLNVSNGIFTDVIWSGFNFVITEIGTIAETIETDFTAWEMRNPNVSSVFFSIAHHGSTYVAATATGVYTSTDLINWTETQPQPAGNSYFNFKDIVWDNSNAQFMALGVNSLTEFSARVYTSPDGSTWTERLNGESKYAQALFTANGNSFFMGGRGRFLSSTDGISWSSVEAHQGNNLGGLTAVGSDGWASVGSNGTIGISSDGDNWTWSSYLCSTWTTNTGWANIAHDGSKYLVVGNDGCIISSTDGTTWVEQNSGVSETITDVLWDGAQFVAVGHSGILLTSPNGVDWTQQTSPTTNILARVIYSEQDGTYVAIGNGSTILTSSDAINWTQQTATEAAPDQLRGLANNNSRYMVSGNNTTALVSVDTNATLWYNSPAAVSATTLRTVGIDYDGSNYTYYAFSDNGRNYSKVSQLGPWSEQANLPMRAAYRFVTNASGRTMVSGQGGFLMSME